MNVSNLDNVKQRIYLQVEKLREKETLKKRGKIMYIFTFQNEGLSYLCLKCII